MTIYCFLELSSGLVPIPGKVIIELFDTQVPLVAENFRALCTGEKGGNLHYQGTQFHRVIETYILQGGDTSGTGSGGSNIYGNEKNAFAGQDLTWRNIDAEMLVCMAETQPRSQFFITLRASPHLDGTICCVGKVIRGQQILQQLSEVEVDEDDKPLEPVTISRCGELEYKGAPIKAAQPKTVSTDFAKRRSASEERSASRKRQSPRDSRRRSASKSPVRRRKKDDDDDDDTYHRDSRDRQRPHHRRQRTSERAPSPESRRRQHTRDSRKTIDEDLYERISRQERAREYQRYKRDPEDKPEVTYKGRGTMMYQSKDSKSRSSYGRLT